MRRQGDRDGDGADLPGRHAAALQAEQFDALVESAIAKRKRQDGDAVETAVDVLHVGIRVIRSIPWRHLSERERGNAHGLLKWHVRRIGQLRKGWNEKKWRGLVREAVLADPTLLIDLCKQHGLHEKAEEVTRYLRQHGRI